MLTSKQRSYLRSLATAEDTILHIGKGGITENIIRQADDALTARELIKGRVLDTAPGTARELAEQIAEAVNAQVVQVVGRNFVLFRPNEKDSRITLPRA